MKDDYKKLKTWWKAHVICDLINDLTYDLSERDADYQLKRDVRRAAEFLEQNVCNAYKARTVQEKYEFMLQACNEASFLRNQLNIGGDVKLMSKDLAVQFQERFNEMFSMIFGLKDLIAQQVSIKRNKN